MARAPLYFVAAVKDFSTALRFHPTREILR
jgi:hypothetical protein